MNLKLLKKAKKHIKELNKNDFLFIYLFNMVNEFIPFFNILISAELLDTIYYFENINIIILNIIILILGNTILSIIRNLILKRFRKEGCILSRKEPMKFNEKSMMIEYEFLEKPDVMSKRNKIHANSAIDKHGIWSFVHSYEGIIRNSVRIFFAIILSIDIFIRIIKNSMITNYSIYLVISFFSLIIVKIVFNIIFSKKRAIASDKLAKSMLVLNKKYYDTNNYKLGKDIRLYKLENIILSEEDAKIKNNHSAYKKYQTEQFKISIPEITLQNMLNGTVYFIASFYTLFGVFQIGVLTKFIGYINSLLNSINELFVVISNMRFNEPFLEEYFSYFELPDSEGSGTLRFEEDFEFKCIEFINVSYKYPYSNDYALKNINIKIKNGDCISVVGKNGSGKSTFIKLLCGLLKPTNGEIRINGINICKYKYEEYLKKISTVFQDYTLFSYTLGEVIANDNTYDLEKVEDAIKKAGFMERYKSLNNGINTYLYKHFDSNGVEISGGEAQKVAIARSLYKNSEIIIFDEPTSSLDPKSEYHLYNNLNDIISNKTTIYISHRLASCNFSNVIYVFDNGKIIECGSHKELINKDGIYSQMWKVQSQHYL